MNDNTIKVNVDRLDTLMNQFSELVIERGQLLQVARKHEQNDFTESAERMNRIISNLQNLLLSMKMVSIEQVFHRLPAFVKDYSSKFNKSVELQMNGLDTEIDRTVIDEIEQPLIQLIQNAIEHGIEPPEERKKVAKPETGVIELNAYHSGNEVYMEVIDDGEGIDWDQLKEKAIKNGSISPLDEEELKNEDLLFAMNSSQKTGEYGLDIVKNKIEELGGSVTVESVKGEGTRFLLHLPLTLSILSAMLIKVAEETYAIPLNSIIETAVYDKESILNTHKQKAIDYRGQVVPLVYLKRIFEVEDNGKEEDSISVVVIKKGEKMAGLVVDQILGQEEVVLKPLGNYLGSVFAISGATILGDGKVALILDSNVLIK